MLLNLDLKIKQVFQCSVSESKRYKCSGYRFWKRIRPVSQKEAGARRELGNLAGCTVYNPGKTLF